jgi:uncharacterized protein (DUF2267 family)
MINFEKFAAEGNAFINELSAKLGHTEEKGQVGIILRSVLHVLRDCMTIQQSFHFLAQLPMFLKAIYVEQWKYSEGPARIKTLEEFAKRVEEEQRKFGERQFDWSESTIDIVKTVINSLHRYVSEGEFNDVIAELPKGIKQLFPEGQKIVK